MKYPITIEMGGPKKSWGVVVPDLPGCFSAADSGIDEAIENAKYLNKKYANDNSKLVAYKCTHCSHYHLTTKFKKIKYD